MKTRTGYLVRRGRVYHAVWTVAGKKFMRSTGKRDRRDAEKELHRIMEPFAAGNEVTILQNIAAKIEGRKAEIARLEDERNPPLSLVATWSAYMDAPGRPDSGESTLRMYESQWFAFLKWMQKKHPDAPALRDVTEDIAAEYAAHLSAGRGLSANSYNKHVRLLAMVFRVLRKLARLEGNPWEEITRKVVSSQSRRELTIDELKKVCRAASGEMRLLFALGIYTGLRLGDAATLRWAETDLPRHEIRRIPNKIARRKPKTVTIPIHPVLGAMLAKIPPAMRGEYVLPDTAELYMRRIPALSSQIQDHFTACGIRTVKRGTGMKIETGANGEPRAVHTGKRAVLEVGFHSLRHTFVSLCREANAPLAVVEAIVGHSNPAMTRHYTHISESAARAAVATLPALMGDAPKALPAPAGLASRDERLRAIVEAMTAETWKADKGRLLAILAGLDNGSV